MPEPPSADLLAGPYAPDSMIPKFALDSAQGLRYRAAWDSMMAATRPVRDSLQEGLGGLQRARGEGYRREGGRQIQRQAKALKKEEARFDKVVRRILTNDQWEEFKDWRDRRRRTERELRQEELRGGRRPWT